MVEELCRRGRQQLRDDAIERFKGQDQCVAWVNAIPSVGPQGPSAEAIQRPLSPTTRTSTQKKLWIGEACASRYFHVRGCNANRATTAMSSTKMTVNSMASPRTVSKSNPHPPGSYSH